MEIDSNVKRAVIEDSEYVKETVDNIVNPHMEELDVMVDKIHNSLKQDVTFTEEQLSKMVLDLNAILYTVIEANTSIDIRQEISSIKQKSDYALARRTSEGTVSDKDNDAWLATQDITVLNLIYKEANKLMKSKVERASELLLSLKKVLSFRIQQMSGMMDQ